jgi:hypothetical protein
MTPFVRASLIAPLTAPLLYCTASLAVAVADPVRRASVGQNLAGGAALVFAFGAPVAYAATFGAGLPALWLMRRFGSLTIGRTVLVGVVVGFGIAAALGPALRGDLVVVVDCLPLSGCTAAQQPHGAAAPLTVCAIMSPRHAAHSAH